MSTVTIETLNRRAEGVAGDKTFHFVLPGEQVNGSTGAVEVASSERISPICPYYGRCGGCQLQHWAEEPYRRWKAELVRSALRQRGLIPPDIPIVDAHGEGRRRVALHVRKREGKVSAGFMAMRSHDLINIDICPVLAPALQRAPDVARALGVILGDCDCWVTLADNGLDVAVKVERKELERALPKLSVAAADLKLARLTVNGEVVVSRDRPMVSMGPAQVAIPPASFLQATAKGEEVLAQLALQGVGKKAKAVADLFCGVGPFAFRLAATARVAAYDSDKPAIAALSAASKATQGLKPITAAVRNLTSEPLVPGELKEFDAVVFDPPRAGAEAQAKKLAVSGVKRVVSVSCDPLTFARDAAILVAGGYKLASVTAVDQFKYTAHVECVGVFQK